MIRTRRVAAASIVVLLAGCGPWSARLQAEPTSDDEPRVERTIAPARSDDAPEPFRAKIDQPAPRITEEQFAETYPWRVDLSDWPEVATLEDAFRAPPEFERLDVEPDSFQAFLRALPLRLDRTTVHAFDGRPLSSPASAIAMLPVGERDLQQCADSILRLHAEYLWQTGRSDEISYHFTSGDESSWKEWQQGERFRVDGNGVERYRGAARPNTHAAFVGYLEHLFMYAGTLSLPKDARRLAEDDPIRAGDFYLESGSPGHVVLVLDVAEGPEGRRAALLGQGFMPAQEFHVIEGSGEDVLGGAWFLLPKEGGTLDTPSWRAFDADDRFRFGRGARR